MVTTRSENVLEKRSKRATRLQYGALAYRTVKDGGPEILLMTSRETKRWIIPKGWPIKGMKPCDSAAQEAFEEAGVRGTVGQRKIGKYTYDKRLGNPTKVVPCEVHVYALRVNIQEENWPEKDQREIIWCQPDEAIAIVDDIDLVPIIRGFVAQGPPDIA